MLFDENSHEFFEIAGPSEARSQNRSQFFWGMKKKSQDRNFSAILTMPAVTGLSRCHILGAHGLTGNKEIITTGDIYFSLKIECVLCVVCCVYAFMYKMRFDLLMPRPQKKMAI